MLRRVALTVVLAAGPVWGQVRPHEVSPAGQRMRPVDQAVEDMDPNAVSTRRVEIGLGVDQTQNSALFVEQVPVDLVHKPQYWRIGPGFRARVDRIDYVTLHRQDPGTRRNPNLVLNQMPAADGFYAELTGPNTIFELTTPGESPIYRIPTRQAAPVIDYAAAPPQDMRIDGRLDYLVDGRINTRVDGELMQAPPESYNLQIDARVVPADSGH